MRASRGWKRHCRIWQHRPLVETCILRVVAWHAPRRGDVDFSRMTDFRIGLGRNVQPDTDWTFDSFERALDDGCCLWRGAWLGCSHSRRQPAILRRFETERLSRLFAPNSKGSSWTIGDSIHSSARWHLARAVARCSRACLDSRLGALGPLLLQVTPTRPGEAIPGRTSRFRPPVTTRASHLNVEGPMGAEERANARTGKYVPPTAPAPRRARRQTIATDARAVQSATRGTSASEPILEHVTRTASRAWFAPERDAFSPARRQIRN